MLKTSVKNSAKVRSALQKKLKEYASDQKVLVGIRGEAGTTEDGSMTLATLGAIHEFGAPNIPERSFLRTGVSDAIPNISSLAESRLGKDGVDKTLNLIGLMAQNAVKKKIVDLRDPANAVSTIRAKGSSNPLIDTGGLLGSITYIVTDEKTDEGL